MKTLAYIVNKYKLDISGKSPLEIPNMGRDNLSGLFCELGFKVGVEIGVEQGIFSQSLCKNNPALKLYAIDPWAAYPGYRLNKTQTLVDAYYSEAKTRLAPYNCTLVRKFSLDAVRDFSDQSLDFVYVDGNHNFQNCTNDIAQWTKKIKFGGVIAGHDYVEHKKPTGMHVFEVVNAYTTAYGISPWFVLGTKAIIASQVRDKVRSFMWVVAPLPGPSRNQQ